MAEETPGAATAPEKTTPSPAATTPPPSDPPAAAAKTDADIEAIAAKAENPDAVRNALQAERDNARAQKERADELAAKVKQFEDASKSEQEKLVEQATGEKARADAAEAQLLRYEVASGKGLPPHLTKFLTGSTKKELEDAADELLKAVKPGRPAGDIDAGKGEPGSGDVTFNDVIRAKAHA